MNRKERLTREAQFTTSAKVISFMFIVGVIVLLAAQAPDHSGQIAIPSTPPAIEQSIGAVGALGSRLSSPEAEAAARTAKQDSAPTHTL